MNIIYAQVVIEVEVLVCILKNLYPIKLVFQSIDFELLVIEFDKKKIFYQEKHYCMYFLQISKFIFEIIS